MSDFVPTHVVPDGGMASWEEPNPDRPSARLDGGLAVEVVETAGAWNRVRCSNGWTGWVDGAQLVATGAANGALPDGELPKVLDDAMTQVASLVSDLKAGRIDEEAFRRGAFRSGLVVRDGDAWILDLESERWWRYDGVGLTTLAVSAPGSEG